MVSEIYSPLSCSVVRSVPNSKLLWPLQMPSFVYKTKHAAKKSYYWSKRHHQSVQHDRWRFVCENFQLRRNSYIYTCWRTSTFTFYVQMISTGIGFDIPNLRFTLSIVVITTRLTLKYKNIQSFLPSLWEWVNYLYVSTCKISKSWNLPWCVGKIHKNARICTH